MVPSLLASKRRNDFGYDYIDNQQYTKWRMMAQTVITAIAPQTHFDSEFKIIDSDNISDSPKRLARQSAVLEALQDDLEGGMLSNVRSIVRAEVFSEMLDQAEHLHTEGYYQASAVIAGAVLEDHLRKLCARYPLVVLPTKPKLDLMNAELARAGEYSLLQQKEVTLWAGIRNAAAHGRLADLTKENTSNLIRGVVRFLNEHVG
jgi:hypothetical protein